ncbi:MAG TPA: ATP-binding cassette domain-containing protein [Candidatus Polarisedimenticolia bacterium]|nr:ATP-binding cassette domain-containing protein [Candidatus Polarisedimenticolia bacterium]
MSIVLERLAKRYDSHLVVNDVSLEVADGEFFVLLGPSGSGKSTVLRLIAGLVETDQGRVRLHGRDVTRLPPRQRDVGLVFQNYALFRHLSVAENIEFALRIRRIPPAERRRRRDELLDLVGLAGFGDRRPRQLSGGQQQRVALARALAHRPEVLLLDEPFGALDARIRTELRRTIRAIQRQLAITTIFVTHDQEEAFELADRMGVMNYGRLLEVGPPQELYLRPQTEFVATFLGTANLMVGELTPQGVRLGPVRFPLSTRGEEADEGRETRRVQVLFRPEDVAVKTTADALGWPLLGKALVEANGFVGSFERLRLRLPKLAGVRPIAPAAPFGGDFLLVEASRSQHQARRFPLHPGDAAWVGVRRVHALTHPGLSFLILTDGSGADEAVLDLGGRIARLAHARVTVLGRAAEDGALRERLQRGPDHSGGGLAALETIPAADDDPAAAVAREATRQHYDLLIQALPARDALDQAERSLQAGDHHLLLVPGPGPVPSRVLICVTVGEPGKEDVQFAGRLTRHLGAQATIMTVLPEGGDVRERDRAGHFLAAGARTLSLLGVEAHTTLRQGPARAEILSEIRQGGHDLVVLGAPMTAYRGRVTLDRLVRALLGDLRDRPILIVRAHEALA